MGLGSLALDAREEDGEGSRKQGRGEEGREGAASRTLPLPPLPPRKEETFPGTFFSQHFFFPSIPLASAH